MSSTMLTLEWFQSTAYGKAWSSLDAIVYENAYLIASTDQRMIDVKHNCHDVYENALSMYIAIILTQGGASDAPVIDTADAGKVAYVTADKVFDVQRNYTLVDAPNLIKGALPSNLLSNIFEQCKSIAVGMRLVRGRIGCGGCGTGSSGITVGDMSDDV